MKRIVLLDVSAIMYRAFYGNMNFRTKNEPTGAVYGFTNTLLSIIKEFSPDYIGAAQDIKRAELKRSKIYSEYKSNRDAMPEDLLVQVDRIEEVLDCFGIDRFKISGYEADDVMGTIGKKFSKENYEIIIITGDKDLTQLLDKNINIALLGKGDGGGFKILSTPEDVKEHLGVYPEMIPDLFGLIGDSSDGIPGVRKVGPKKAIPMLEKYKNLEGIYENIDSLKEISGIGPSLINNIKEDKEIAFLSRNLATIETNIPLEIKIEDLEYNVDNRKLLSLFKELGFKALIKRMGLSEEEEKEKYEEKETSEQVGQLGLFNVENESVLKPKKEKDSMVMIIDTEEKFEKMYNDLKSEEFIYFYAENIGVVFAGEERDYYVPLYHNLKIGEKYGNLDKKLIEKIFSMDKKFVTYNFKNILRNYYKIPTENMEFDEMLAYHLITAQTRENIESMIAAETMKDIKKYADIFGKEKPEETDIEKYGNYIRERGEAVRELHFSLKEQLEEKNLIPVLKEIEIPLIEVLNSMEEEGIMINPEYFYEFGAKVGEKLNILEEKIYEIAGGKFNLNSPKQLAEVLFINLNIAPVKKTKTGLSTNVEVLEELEARGEEIAKYILEYRKLSKLKSTYIDALPKSADKNNRIHTNFNQTGTATGRLSSSDPNLQNIPVKTDDGMRIREGFIAKKGYKLLGIDYSQIELRVLTEISEDENLIKAYAEGKDLHDLTARKIFGLSESEEVTREQRTAAKIVNFSIIYGKTAFGLSKELKITRKDAEDYIAKYFAEYPKVRELETEIIQKAEETGYAETYFNRRRDIEGIHSRNKNIKNQGERMAVNTVIQGTAAEVIKKVMIELYKFLRGKEDIKMLLQVHDELIFEIKDEKVEEYRTVIENIMRNSVKFKNVKLEVNSSVGNNWAEAK
ncbi:DNA polymerase I [Fusobacterium perfoetens]|uniref:DNA polymerase I n=1 Tax=Fusobacterium perfoetens TaxID=852 RepID=UPI001F360822|nr:DNA polymerase I [Fusobacterium perfoetens]MCF2624692.1 DNA polymerase I [Fusobacterium perfoetens]